MNFFNQYGIYLLIIGFFAYKFMKSYLVKKKLPEYLSQGAILLDVRSTGEYAQNCAPKTINIPLGELTSRLGELPKDRPVVVCCASGTRSGMAKALLKKNGYTNVHNIGSWTNFLHLK